MKRGYFSDSIYITLVKCVGCIVMSGAVKIIINCNVCTLDVVIWSFVLCITIK